MAQDIRRVSDTKLWQFRTAASKSLIDYARQRLARHYAAAGASAERVEQARHLFDPNALTLGFARRFATYKRPNLLLHDPERLLRLLTNPQRPVQLILAGKAHPADVAGQALIQQWIHFIRQTEARPHAIFLSDYDMLMTEHLVQGVDVWLNTPRRPWEACGTSGMKVLVPNSMAGGPRPTRPTWDGLLATAASTAMIQLGTLRKPNSSIRYWSSTWSPSFTAEIKPAYLSHGFSACAKAWPA